MTLKRLETWRKYNSIMTYGLYIYLKDARLSSADGCNTSAKSWLPVCVAFALDRNLRKSLAAFGKGIIPCEGGRWRQRSRLPAALINDWIKGRYPTWPKGDTLWWRAAAFHFLLFSPEAESPSPLPPLSQTLPLSHSLSFSSPTIPQNCANAVLPLWRARPSATSSVCVHVCVCVCQCQWQPVWSQAFCDKFFYFIPVWNCLVCRLSCYFERIYSNVLNCCTVLFMAAGCNIGLLSNSSMRHIANWINRL